MQCMAQESTAEESVHTRGLRGSDWTDGLRQDQGQTEVYLRHRKRGKEEDRDVNRVMCVTGSDWRSRFMIGRDETPNRSPSSDLLIPNPEVFYE